MNRRQFMGTAAALPAVMRAAFHRPIGVQIYSVRTLMATKGAETLRALAAIGYKEVEISLAEAKKFAGVLKETGLKATGSHLDPDLSAIGGAKLEEAIGQAQELGIGAIGLAYVMPADRKDPASFWPGFAEKMNDAGARCKKAGLTFYYHHHNFEFDPKFRAIDVLHAKLGKDVKLEIDCFWASVGGMDPAGMIQQWSGRIFALHLKDKGKSTPDSYETSAVKHEEFLEVGAGSIDWSKVLKAAEKAGVQHYYVEQDYTPGDPVASLKKSYDYLRKVS